MNTLPLSKKKALFYPVFINVPGNYNFMEEWEIIKIGGFFDEKY